MGQAFDLSDPLGGQNLQTAFQRDGSNSSETYEACSGNLLADYQFSASVDPDQVKRAT